MNVSPFIKQLFVAGAPLLASLSVGGSVSFPTVLLTQLRRKDTTIPLDFDTASWIGAIHGLAGLPSILMPTIMQWRGRKIAFIIACLVIILGWVIAYTATNVTAILFSESFLGFGGNSIYAITCLTITEMVTPKYRETFIQMYYIFMPSTMALSGLLIQYLHWKTIALVMCMPMVIALIIACMWPESPYWLAYRGEFEKCEKSFIWLRGTDAQSRMELIKLIQSQKETIKNDRKFKRTSFKQFLQKIRQRDFYLPLGHVFIMESIVQSIGSVVMMIYANEIFRKASTNNVIAIYGTFIVNTIQVLGVAVTIAFNKYFKRKTALLWSISAAVTCLISASVTSYLQSIGTLADDSLICSYCLIAFMVSISLGVVPIAYPVASSLMPVKHRGIGGVIYVAHTCIFHTIALKSAPYMFLHINLYGTFLVYALNGIILGLLIWKFIPETKGRTLQEIEYFYTYGEFHRNIIVRNENFIELLGGDNFPKNTIVGNDNKIDV